MNTIIEAIVKIVVEVILAILSRKSDCGECSPK